MPYKIENQSLRANSTRRCDGLPEKTQTPSSSTASTGMQRIVSFVYYLLSTSFSTVPSQCAERKPPFSSRTRLNSSHVSTFVIIDSR